MPGPVDTPPIDPVQGRRKRGGAFVRWLYGTGVLALAAYLAWAGGRSLIFLEGPGYVAAPKYLASTPYLSQVTHMNVSAGVTVDAGDILAFSTSPQVEREKTELLRLELEQSNREGELKIRLRIATATLSASKDRLSFADEALARMAEHNVAVSTAYKMEVLRERSDALLLNAQAEAETAEIHVQLDRIHAHMDTMKDRVARLDRDFAGGVIASPVAGVVGLALAHDGEVISPGQTIAEIYDIAATYIDWHVPSFRLYAPRTGDVVFIYRGNGFTRGYVWEILNLAESDRGQGESVLRTPRVKQVVRVKTLREDEILPLHSEVTIRMNYFHGLDALLARLEGWFR